MRYKLLPTQIIHWDNEGMFKVNSSTDIIYSVATGEIYKVDNGSLPIILEGQIRIKRDDVDIFSCIFHTKAQLFFDFNENPINDLVALLKEVQKKEQLIWDSRIIATPLHGIFLENAESNPNSLLNLSCHLRDAAKSRNLIA